MSHSSLFFRFTFLTFLLVLNASTQKANQLALRLDKLIGISAVAFLPLRLGKGGLHHALSYIDYYSVEYTLREVCG